MPIAALKRRRRSIALLALAGWLLALATSIAHGCQGCMEGSSHRWASVASPSNALATSALTFQLASVTHFDLPCPVADATAPSLIVKESALDDTSHRRLIPLLPASVQAVLPPVVDLRPASASPGVAVALLHSIRLLI